LSAGDRVRAQKKCMGHRATIVGGAKNNFIIGTKHRDVIVAGAGLDKVIARGGRDIICGGRGSDLLDGSKGRDKINGGAARDQCFGKNREHRKHRKCEIHSLPTPPDRGTPRVQPSSSARIVAAAQRSHSLAVDAPECTGYVGSGGASRFGNVHYTGAYSNGWIALRLHIWGWNGGGWDYAGTGPWEVRPASAGQSYSVNMGTAPMRGFAMGFTWEAFWADSSGAWDASTQVQVSPSYYLIPMPSAPGLTMTAGFCG
jgi:hypothetical protein